MTTSTIPTSLLVLGGSSEIAVATVSELAGRGLQRVVLAGRSTTRLDETAAKLASSGIDVSQAIFDATDTANHGAFFENVSSTSGPFDAVLLAFGVLGDTFDLDTDPASAAELIEVNFSGAASAAIAASQMLTAGGGGTLAVISSITAMRPRRANMIYGAAKAGLDAFSTALNDALAHTAVDVMIIRPGFVHTRMTEGVDPAPFATTADAVAVDIADGLASGASVVWSPAILKFVAPVLKAMPRPLWRKISAR